MAFITDYVAVDRIIDHLNLTFVAEKPPPSRVLTEVALTAIEKALSLTKSKDSISRYESVRKQIKDALVKKQS